MYLNMKRRQRQEVYCWKQGAWQIPKKKTIQNYSFVQNKSENNNCNLLKNVKYIFLQ